MTIIIVIIIIIIMNGRIQDLDWRGAGLVPKGKNRGGAENMRRGQRLEP